jgi:hypothetical protein
MAAMVEIIAMCSAIEVQCPAKEKKRKLKWLH